jgi:hypothetical protein
MANEEMIMIDDPEALVKWATTAKRGSKISYYKGWLMKERMMLHQMEIRGPAALPRFRVANKAWDFMELGVIDLFQKRLGVDTYLYIAVKT